MTATPQGSTPGPLSVLDNGRSLVHVETGEGHPLGVGRAICSFTRDRIEYAHLLASAPTMRARIDALESFVRRVAEHFDGTDAPLGVDARALLAKDGAQ